MGVPEVPQIEIRKFVRFVDLPQRWHFADSRYADLIYLWNLRICDLRTQAFCGLQVCKYIPTLCPSKHSISKFVQNKKIVLKRQLLGSVLRQSWAVFCVGRFAICELVMRFCWFSVPEWAQEFADFSVCKLYKKSFLVNLCRLAGTLASKGTFLRWLAFTNRKSPNLQWRQMLIILLHIEFMPICLQKSFCNPALLPPFL